MSVQRACRPAPRPERAQRDHCRDQQARTRAQCRHLRRRFAHLAFFACCMLPPAIFWLTDSISNQSSSSAQQTQRNK